MSKRPKTITCLHCGKRSANSKSGSTRKYCSQVCKRAAKVANAIKQGLCSTCGSRPARPGLRTCKECVDRKEVHRYAAQGGPKIGKEIPCKRCGKMFVKESPRSLYCSLYCVTQAEYDKKRQLKERNCVHCGDSFFPRSDRQIFCEKIACREAKRKASLSRTTRPCAHCGVAFEAKRLDHLYCGKKCRDKASDIRTGRVPQIRPSRQCDVCYGDMFNPMATQRYCSPACQREGALIRANSLRPPKHEKRPCIVCDKEYHPRHANSVACSPGCRKKLKKGLENGFSVVTINSKPSVTLKTIRSDLGRIDAGWIWQKSFGIDFDDDEIISMTPREKYRAGVSLAQQCRQLFGIRKGSETDIFQGVRV